MFHLYQVVAEDARYRVSNFLKALDTANRANLEIINVSLGVYHDDCDGECRSCEAVNRVVDSGTTVIVAAGTRRKGSHESTYCPGLSTKALTTSVVVPSCTAKPENTSPRGFIRKWRPPNALWMLQQAEGPTEEEVYFYSDNLCSFEYCAPRVGCKNNRVEEPWEFNPEPDSGKPDILAPGFHATATPRGLRVATGTSYSAAMTSGAIAEILGELFNLGQTASPSKIKEAVVDSGKIVQGSTIRKLDQLETFRRLV